MPLLWQLLAALNHDALIRMPRQLVVEVGERPCDGLGWILRARDDVIRGTSSLENPQGVGNKKVCTYPKRYLAMESQGDRGIR